MNIDNVDQGLVYALTTLYYSYESMSCISLPAHRTDRELPDYLQSCDLPPCLALTQFFPLSELTVCLWERMYGYVTVNV